MADKPAIESRGVNFWAHIKNWYEVHSLEDNKKLLDDMAGMGFNDFWITLERGGLMNYLDESVADDTSRQFWAKLKSLACSAHDLGMKVTLLDENNVVFVDQWSRPEAAELIAVTPRPAKSLWRPYQLCPSKPKARAMILKDHEESYRDFPVVDALVIWPYDNGGCGCDDCHPWPKTFFKLSQEMAASLRRYHPKAAVYLGAWDMTDEEIGLLSELLADDHTGTFQGIVHKDWLILDLHSDGRPAERWAKLPERYQKVPYIDLCQIGAWGWHSFTAQPYPTRFERMFKAMREAGITNFSSYSEDLHDDINKYVVARLEGQHRHTARELIKDYCMRYFQAAVGDDMFELCCLMENEYTNPWGSPWVQKPIMSVEKARQMLAMVEDIERRLPSYVIPGWRWQVIRKRAELSVLINEIGQPEDGKAELEELLRAAIAAPIAEEANSILAKANVYIARKREQLERLRTTIDSFKYDVLQEPLDRGIRVTGALPTYFTWLRMLLDMEETTVTAIGRGHKKHQEDILRERLRVLAGERQTPTAED